MTLKLKLPVSFLILAIYVIILNSCSDDSINSPMITIEANKTEIMANGTETITFKVKDQNGGDVTTMAKIYKDGSEFNGQTFFSSIAKTSRFYAELNGLKSNILIINVKPILKHKKNILIEDYTGTWCGYCPRVSKTIEDIIKANSRIDVVAIHNDNDMMYSDLKTLTNIFNITSYPTAYIDRSYKWPFPESAEGLQTALKRPALCGISLESAITENKATLKVNVEFAGGYVNRTRIVIFIIENNLLFNQTNFYPQYGANPIVNFRHDHVLRSAITSSTGEEIPETGPAIFSKEYQFNIGNYKPENIQFVVFVTDTDSNECLNSISVKPGLKNANPRI